MPRSKMAGFIPAMWARSTDQAIVGALAHRDRVTADTSLDELGLSSLERIELMTLLEEQFDTTLDEAAFSSAGTVGDLEALVRQASGAAPGAPPTAGAQISEGRQTSPAERITFPAWNTGIVARAVRRASLPTWILPLARVFAWIRVEGIEHLRRIDGPVVFVANHQSHMDTPAILIALPPRWRYRVAPAMAKDFFDAHFHPERHTWREVLMFRAGYYLAALFFTRSRSHDGRPAHGRRCGIWENS